MKKRKYQFVVMLSIAAFLTLSGVAYAFSGGGKWTGTFQAEHAEASWEYKVIPISQASRIEDGTFEGELNKLGNEGWELAAVVTTQSGGYYIMKRA